MSLVKVICVMKNKDYKGWKELKGKIAASFGGAVSADPPLSLTGRSFLRMKLWGTASCLPHKASSFAL